LHAVQAEKIRNHFAFLILENYISQSSVVFGVSEGSFDRRGLKIKVTETDLQTDNEKSLLIPKTLAVLVHHRTPCVYGLHQAHGEFPARSSRAAYAG